MSSSEALLIKSCQEIIVCKSFSFKELRHGRRYVTMGVSVLVRTLQFGVTMVMDSIPYIILGSLICGFCYGLSPRCC